LSILNHRSVRPAQITKASLSGWLHSLASHLQDLLLRWQAWQSVARHVHELAVGGVPHLRDFQAFGVEVFVVLARVRRIPAEMPDRGLGPGQLCLRRSVYLREEQIYVACFDRLIAIERRPGGRHWKRLQVVVGGSFWVHRIQMNVMNMHRRDGRLPLREDRPARCHENPHQHHHQGHDAISHFDTSSVVQHHDNIPPSESNRLEICRPAVI
jgi:hypothetical protein